MKMSKLFGLSFSAFVSVVFGVALFFLGYRLGSLDDNTVKKREEMLYTVFIPFAMTSAAGFITWSINNEISEGSKGEIESHKEDYEKKRGQYKAMYFTSLNHAKKILEPLKLSGEIYQKCLIELENCEHLLNDFEEKKEASDRIYLWLSDPEHRRLLKEYTVSQASQSHEIPPHKVKIFQRDIGRCINWLRDSINRLQGYEVIKDKLAESYHDIPDGLNAHITALNSIKSHNELFELSKDSGVLEDFIEELVERLRS